MDALEISEHRASGYGPRTYANANDAHLTIAVAANFSTAGERLTKKAAGDAYLALPLDRAPIEAGRDIYRQLARRGLEAPVINVAGNGLHSLARHGIDQDAINAHLHEMLAPVHEHWPIARIISGGQTGVDMAGGVAGRALDIPVRLLLPKGYRQRGADGVDQLHEATDIAEQVATGVARLVGTDTAPDHGP